MDLHEIASAEWFDVDQSGSSRIELPAPDSDYAYAAARLLSWYPVINTRGATYEPEDLDDELLSTLIGKQVNLEHDKLTQVIGSVISYLKTEDGVDIGIRIDREQAAFHGLEMADMQSGNFFSRCSLEVSRDPAQSQFYAYDEGFNVKRRIPSESGAEQGIRRTTVYDPFTLQGLKVAERIKPARFTGVGLVPIPADKTSRIYAVTASDGDDPERLKTTMDEFFELLPEDLEALNLEHEEAAAALTPGKNHADPGYQPDKRPRYQLDTAEKTAAAARFFGRDSYREKYTPAQRAHIDAKINAAKKKFGIGNAETASTTTPPGESYNMSATDIELLQGKVATLEAAVASLTSQKELASAEGATAKTRVTELEVKVQELETELASANATIIDFRNKEVAAALEAKTNSLLDELNTIHPFKDDADRASLKEKAAAACDNEGVVHQLRIERKLAASEAKVAELEAKVSAPPADDAAAAAAAQAANAGAAAADAGAAPAAAAVETKEIASAEFEPGSDARQEIKFDPIEIRGVKLTPASLI